MIGENTELVFLDWDEPQSGDLPAQEQGYAQGPERALMSALLFDAVQLLLSGKQCQRASDSIALRETRAWIMSCDREYVFSFENVCDALGMNSGYLRLGIINAYNSKRCRRIRRRDS